MKAKCPCKNCTPDTGRTGYCHDSCERYIIWAGGHRLAKAVLREEKNMDRAVNSVIWASGGGRG